MAAPGPSENELKESIRFAATKLGIEEVRDAQESALLQYLRHRDVFVSLETGGGKSFIFQAAPLCHDFMKARHQPKRADCQKSLAIVVSPITALIEDQIASLKKKNIPAIHLNRCSDDDSIEEWSISSKKITTGDVSLVYTSPETLATKRCRDLLAQTNVRENVCGIFVDESHCVYKWGHSSNEAKAFRADYNRLADLRAFLPSNVPVVTLTATATSQVRQAILRSLQMTNVHFIEGSPNRENIKYIVVNSPSKKPHHDVTTWSWLTSRLNRLQGNTPRVIIYCRSRTQCTSLYGIFKSTVSSDIHFAMYHAATAKDVQLDIVKDFENENGDIRVLFATIAFGMGVDVKGVHTILHLGVPGDVDDYIQESGRAGRDGKQSVSVLLKYPGMYSDSKVEKRMKEFVDNTEQCRRKLLLGHYDVHDHEHANAAHTCCDICTLSCECDVDKSESDVDKCESMQACQEETDILIHLGFVHQSKGDTTYLPRRQVSNSARESLKQKLQEHRKSLLDEKTPYLAGADITCGLPLATIDKVTMECSIVMPYEVFRNRYAVYSEEITQTIWNITEDTLRGCAILEARPAKDLHVVDEESETDDDDKISDDEQEYDWHEFDNEGMFVRSDSD